MTSASRRLLATLSAVVLIVAVLQTSIVPALAVVAQELHAAPVAVSWAVTANLLAAAAATPLVGRLADLVNKKTVLLAALGLIVAGSLLAATTSSLPWLITGRVLQGMSFSLYPVAVSILREEIAPERLVRGIATLSAMLGLGGAAGLVVTGLLMTPGASYHRVFWLNAAVAVIATAAAVVVVPSRPRRGAARVDWVGAGGLAVGLTGLMLAINQGSSWGWASVRTVAVSVAGIAVLAWWWTRSRRHPDALVPTGLLLRRPVLLANAATFLVGMGLYFSFLGMTDFVEAAPGSGYGFGASVLQASLQFLLPGALAAAFTAFVSGRIIEMLGARTVVAGGGLAGAVGFLLLAQWHSTRWEVMLAGLLTNAYISLAYGALPTLIVGDVAPAETGIATSVNGIFRKVGGAVAAALVAALLVPNTAGSIPESGFTAIFLLGSATAAGSVLLVAIGRAKAPARPSRTPGRLPDPQVPNDPRPAESVAAPEVATPRIRVRRPRGPRRPGPAGGSSQTPASPRPALPRYATAAG